MGFFDIKLILILFLIIAIYYIYIELITVKKNINQINLHMNASTKYINSNVNKKIKKNSLNFNLEDEMKYFDSKSLNNDKELNNDTKLNNDTNLNNDTKLNNDTNLNNESNFFGGDLLNVNNPFTMLQQIHLMQNDFEGDMINPVVIIRASSAANNFENDLMNVIESEMQNISHVIQNMMDPEVNGMTRIDIPLKLNENEVKVEVLESEESKSKTSSHVEVYSNDSEEKEDIITNVQLNNKKKKDYDLILNNLTKLKLPELQDLSIDFKLPIQINQKKKTRTELMSNIKDYILNLKNETS
jgi:hypothetical protein